MRAVLCNMLRLLGLVLVFFLGKNIAQYEDLLCGWLGPQLWSYEIYCFFQADTCSLPVAYSDFRAFLSYRSSDLNLIDMCMSRQIRVSFGI